MCLNLQEINFYVIHYYKENHKNPMIILVVVQASKPAAQSSSGGTVTGVTATFPIVITGNPALAPNITITEAYPRTVAQMQALATGGTLVAGLIYQITNAYGSTAVINIKAYSTSVLEDYGFGTYLSGNMIVSINCFMWYDLTTNKILRIYDPVKNNDVKQKDGNSIDTFCFDSTTHKNNIIVDCTLLGDGDSKTVSGCYFASGSSVSINNFNHSLSNCMVGAGKTLDLSNLLQMYVASGKVYDGSISTFEVTPSDNINVDPSAGTIDMSQFSWAGILRFDNGGNVDNFINFPLDHTWILCPKVGGATNNSTIRDNGVSSGNIYLEVASTSIIIDKNTGAGDFVEFQSGVLDNTKVQKIAGYIRS